MKQPEYKEGPEAQGNFERGMKGLFQVSKADIVQREKQKKQRKGSFTNPLLYTPGDIPTSSPSACQFRGCGNVGPYEYRLRAAHHLLAP